HDTASAVSCTPCDADSKWLYISSGTWALLGAELAQPFLKTTALDAHYTNEGAVDGKIRFLTNIMGTWLLQETRRVWQESGRDISFAQMEQMAQTAPDAGLIFPPNDPVFLAPGDMPGRIREWFRNAGKPVPESDEALLRAIYDSLAICFRDSIQALEKLLGTKYDVLHILGGAIRDEFLMKLTAKATGMKVLTGPLEATATGNILAQMLADGTIADVQSARELVRRSCEIKEY
ncbi:MAG: rhamnulokinase, partial [Lentisphaeria bacterium]|nr:rhamnulokinase [Lentisphaeria bacterium]